MSTFTCPRCGRTSAHPTDAAEGYCGNCHDWVRDDTIDVGIRTLAITYNPLADTAYIRFSDEDVYLTRATTARAHYDLDGEGHVVGVELFDVLAAATRVSDDDPAWLARVQQALAEAEASDPEVRAARGRLDQAFEAWRSAAERRRNEGDESGPQADTHRG